MIIRHTEQIIINTGEDGTESVHYKSYDTPIDHYSFEKWYKFRGILIESETNSTLKDLVDKTEMLYDLLKENDRS